MSYYVVSFTVIVVCVILGDVYCRDASYIRQTDIHNNNWPKLPTWESAQKNTTTPWPALGNDRYRSNSNIGNNPSWVRPTIRQNAMTWQNQGPTRNFNVGAYQGGNRQEGTRPVVSLPSEVTDNELRDFSESLLNEDVNNAGKYVTINLQSKTTSRSERDEAPLPLLSIEKEAFKISTIEKLLNLHDNYVVESKESEQYTTQEMKEEDALLNAIIQTSIMQNTRNFLIQKGAIGQDPKQFKNILSEIWFNMYARGGRRVGSSGFEHVFLTEIKNNQISGLHNWIYFDDAERKNQANYLGYMKQIDLGSKGAILKFHFTFRGIDKPVGSMFIGTSPEFEMALYTTCFMLRADKPCPLKLNGNRFVIRTYTYKYRGKNLIGSAFPDI